MFWKETFPTTVQRNILAKNAVVNMALVYFYTNLKILNQKLMTATIIKMTQMYIICQLSTLTLLFQQLLKVAMFYYKQPSQKLPTKEGVILRKLEFDLVQIIRSYSYEHVRKKLNLKTTRKEKLFYRNTCRWLTIFRRTGCSWSDIKNGIFYKADLDMEPDLQKNRTPDL